MPLEALDVPMDPIDAEVESKTLIERLTEKEFRPLIWEQTRLARAELKQNSHQLEDLRVVLERAEKAIISLREASDGQNVRLARLEAWKNMGTGALAVVLIVLVPIFLQLVARGS